MNRCEVVLTDEYSQGGVWHSYYTIKGEEGIDCGQISLLNFQIEKPFIQNWTYLQSIEICRSRRGEGLGTAAIKWLNMELLAKKCHGALINATERKYRNFYKNNGWSELEEGSSWMFYNSEELSKYCLKSASMVFVDFITQRRKN